MYILAARHHQTGRTTTTRSTLKANLSATPIVAAIAPVHPNLPSQRQPTGHVSLTTTTGQWCAAADTNQ